MNRTERSFTLLELILVVILIGIMTGVGIPGYQKAIEKNEERTAIVKLQAIRAGMIIYKAKYGNYPAFNMPDLTSINQNLGLSVVPGTMTYQCFPVDGGDINSCKIISPNGWIIHWHNDDIIHCWGGAPPCPTCKNSALGGCGSG